MGDLDPRRVTSSLPVSLSHNFTVLSQLPDTIRGRAVSIGDGHLIVATARGQVRVLVTEDTRFRVRGVRDPGLEDILPGALVQATGEWTADRALTARSVVAVNPGVTDVQGTRDGAVGLGSGGAPLAR